MPSRNWNADYGAGGGYFIAVAEGVGDACGNCNGNMVAVGVTVGEAVGVGVDDAGNAGDDVEG